MRGGPLCNPDVVSALQPFIVTWWGQADRAEPPPEVRAVYDAWRGRGGSNVTVFVLDSRGALKHAFNGFPNHQSIPAGPSTDAISRYFVEQIGHVDVPEKRENALKLPDVQSGVRIFIRLKDVHLFDSYKSPVVEVVSNRDEWETLAHSERARDIDASKLARWLRLCYPPGINEQLKPYAVVGGTLALRPSGTRASILSGKVRLALSDGAERSFEGTFEAVVNYSREGTVESFRGVVQGAYPRKTPNRGWISMPLVAAIESRPK